jgi:hypothetical protein
MADAATTRKVPITVPVADVTVIEWLKKQHSSSESVRRLIRESVEREGFIDVANRPVTPLSAAPQAASDPKPQAAPAVSPKKAAPIAPEPPAAFAPPAATPRADDASASATIDDLLGL